LPNSYQHQRFNSTAVTATSTVSGPSSLIGRGQASSIDSELPSHGAATVNGDYGSSTKSLTGNSSVVRRDSGNRQTPLTNRSPSVTSGNSKSFRAETTSMPPLSADPSVNGGDAVSRPSSSVGHASTSTVTLTSSSSVTMATSGATKSLSSSNRSTSAAAAVTASSRKNTLDVYYGQPEARFVRRHFIATERSLSIHCYFYIRQ